MSRRRRPAALPRPTPHSPSLIPRILRRRCRLPHPSRCASRRRVRFPMTSRAAAGCRRPAMPRRPRHRRPEPLRRVPRRPWPAAPPTLPRRAATRSSRRPRRRLTPKPGDQARSARAPRRMRRSRQLPPPQQQPPPQQPPPRQPPDPQRGLVCRSRTLMPADRPAAIVRLPPPPPQPRHSPPRRRRSPARIRSPLPSRPLRRAKARPPEDAAALSLRARRRARLLRLLRLARRARAVRPVSGPRVQLRAPPRARQRVQQLAPQ